MEENIDNTSENVNHEERKEKPKGHTSLNAFLVPGAIVLAGIIIAGAVVATNISSSGQTGVAADDSFGNALSAAGKNMRPVDPDEHIRGNPDASITIVEYSDFECPFCARFHPTMEQIVEEFPEVRWVYRHFPLTSIHSRAFGAAIASECIASNAGNDAFWEFADLLFKNQHALGDEQYVSFAKQSGISENKFRACLSSDEMKNIVDADFQNAIDSGAQGTPYSVIINADGETFPFSGALPYEQVRGLVEQAINS